MINPGDEFVNRNREYEQRLSDLTFKYYRLSEQSKDIANRLKELDLMITELLGAVHVNEKAAKEFDSYLAVKENAVRLEDVKKGVQLAGNKETK